MQKKLSEILTKVSFSRYTLTDFDTENDPVITSLEFDSRKITKNSLYFSLPGTHVHGNQFIPQAIQKGAAAIVFQDDLESQKEEILALLQVIPQEQQPVFIKVENSRYAMAPISDAFYDYPSTKLGIIGVTGTEGKSTTVYLIWQFLRLMNKKAGFISTVQYSLGDEALDNSEHQTTPEAPIINQRLFAMIENGCEFAVVESSSHGLSEKTNRLGTISFDAGAMMNVTHEHLEFHGTHSQYKYDKANLFRALDKYCHTKTICQQKTTLTPVSAVNMEDESASYFNDSTQAKTIGFTIKPLEQAAFIPEEYYYVTDIINSPEGSTFVVHHNISQKQHEIQSYLPGEFNIYNILAAAILVAGLLEKDVFEVLSYTHELKPVKGRMTQIKQGQNFEVFVDYAHTPSSFETIFPPLRKRAKGKIIVLFGSGGERDTIKRPIQGEIASKYCDIVILADEDPRGEDPVTLLEMIAAGCKNLIREESLFIIPDRKKAIRKAFSLAQENDIVLLLGKSHENSIIYKDYIMPYDEITEAEKALQELKK